MSKVETLPPFINSLLGQELLVSLIQELVILAIILPFWGVIKKFARTVREHSRRQEFLFWFVLFLVVAVLPPLLSIYKPLYSVDLLMGIAVGLLAALPLTLVVMFIFVSMVVIFAIESIEIDSREFVQRFVRLYFSFAMLVGLPFALMLMIADHRKYEVLPQLMPDTINHNENALTSPNEGKSDSVEK